MKRGEEKRKHKRIEDIFIVTYRLKAAIDVKLTDDGHHEYAAVAMDISEGGIGVDVAHKIPLGSHLVMQFTLVNPLSPSEDGRQRTFELDGQCQYCAPTDKNSFRVGVLFQNMTIEDTEFISEYVRVQALRKSAEE